jgi:hypothetical protein
MIHEVNREEEYITLDVFHNTRCVGIGLCRKESS